jgi:hypothetical protein
LLVPVPPGAQGPIPAPSHVDRRLLDIKTAAAYLGLSPWVLRDLVGQGIIPRVAIPLAGGGALRKILIDRQDLDQLIGAWKTGEPSDAG